jgi:dihydrofolate reductase
MNEGDPRTQAREVSLIMSITVDGFVARSDGGLWHAFPWPAEMQRFATDFYRSVGTAIYGRKTYDAIVPWWRNVSEGRYPAGTEITESEVELANVLQGIEKIVFSRTMDAEAVPDRVVATDLVGEVARIKAQPGSRIAVHGGASVAVPLLDAALIDDLLLFVSPAALGTGKPLFAGLSAELDLTLLDSQVFNGSVVLLHYRP